MKAQRVLIGLLVTGLVSVGSLASAGVILKPSGAGDALALRDWWSGSYYGVSAESSTSSHYFFDSGMKYWSLPVFHFPLGSLTAADVWSAKLSVYFDGHDGTSALRYLNASGSGTVTAMDYVNAGTVVGAMTYSGPGWYNWDVTTQVLAAIDAEYSHAVFFVRPDNYSNGTVYFSESGGSSPQIEVIPEPLTLPLLGAGVGVAILARRRRAIATRQTR